MPPDDPRPALRREMRARRRALPPAERERAALCLGAEIGGLYFFRYYDCRLNHLVFEHGADKEVIKTIFKDYPVVRILLMSLCGAVFCLFLVAMTISPAGAQQSAAAAWYWDRPGRSFVY